MSIQEAIEAGRVAGRLALYFGCWDMPGHYLHNANGRTVWDRLSGFPWSGSLVDGGLLHNGEHADTCDGKVWWTCGGLHFWYAFFWWDRSVDSRGACNSGFYVRGFGWPEPQAAFDYACGEFPKIVARQKFPLILQSPRT